MDCTGVGRATEREAPLISVVIPSVTGWPSLQECLGAVSQQEGIDAAEIIVVDRRGSEVTTPLRSHFPQVILVEAGHGSSIPVLRALGFASARGKMLALTEDHCLPEPGWIHAIVRAFRAGHAVVGGAVENAATERLVDWAAFFCEYGRYMAPVRDGSTDDISGNNCAWNREMLDRLGIDLRREVWDTVLLADLRKLGLRSDPAMVVRHRRSFRFFEFMCQRYHYSRAFAGLRLAGAPWWKRTVYALGTGLLPPLLAVRTARTAFAKRRHLLKYLQATPVLIAFFASWAWGECVGALCGPGRSPELVE